jgi:hypothetical protein
MGKGRSMTARLHAELRSLIGVLFSGDISDEDWALLQIHTAYCPACREILGWSARCFVPLDELV